VGGREMALAAAAAPREGGRAIFDASIGNEPRGSVCAASGAQLGQSERANKSASIGLRPAEVGWDVSGLGAV